MASAKVQSTASNMSTFAQPPFSMTELRDSDRNTVRQRRRSVASISSRIALPRKDSCLLSDEKTNRKSSDAPRHRPASICTALGGSADSIISNLRAEKRTASSMGLREQEQHMVKIGRENWALKIDVTMLKKKRDELGSLNEKLTRQVETLNRENRQLKRDLAQTKQQLEQRERELDEACRLYESLGATSVVLEKLSKKQQAHQHHQQLPHREGYLSARGSYVSPRNPIMKIEGSRPSSRLAYPKSPQSGSQAPEFLGRPIRTSVRVSPTTYDASTTSTSAGISRSGLQSPLPNKSQMLGLPFPSSPSVSTCCSLPRIPIPRHMEFDSEEDDDSSSGEDMATPQNGCQSGKESDDDGYTSDSETEYPQKEDLKKPISLPQLATIEATLGREYTANITPPSSIASAYTKGGSLRRRILKFNREDEPDTSDDSSGEDDMFDSDVGGSTTSLQHTLTPMTASPEPNKAYLVLNEQDMDGKPRASAVAAVAKRVSYTGAVGADLDPIDEQPPLTYRYLMLDDLLSPERFDSAASSVVNVNTRVNWSRIPVPSTTSAVVQKRRKHLDSLSRLVVAREVLAKKILQA